MGKTSTSSNIRPSRVGRSRRIPETFGRVPLCGFGGAVVGSGGGVRLACTGSVLFVCESGSTPIARTVAREHVGEISTVAASAAAGAVSKDPRGILTAKGTDAAPAKSNDKAPAANTKLIDIRKGEWSLALLLCAYFFTVVTTFWILKPLKKGVFIGQFKDAGVHILGFHLTAAQGELIAKVANMVVAFAAAVLFTALSKKLRRQKLTYAFSAILAVAFLYFAWAARSWAGYEVWAFYLFGDLYSTLMVACFFAFANDSVDSGTAKRLYGVVGLGGVAGGAFGSSIVAGAVKMLSIPGWMFVCLGLGVVILGLAWAAARAAEAHTASLPAVKEKPKQEEKTGGKDDNAALKGAKLVLTSRYLLAIVAIVGLYEMVSTIMDFQFTTAVQKSLDAAAIPGHFAKVFAITNWAALIIQLVFTSFVMRKFGLTVALLVLPIAAAIGSTAFLIMPSLITGSALNTADNAFSYSINQSSKEVLYVPTTSDEKYAAKAFIDMFLQRFAKAVAVLLSLGISIWFSFNSIRYLSIATLILLGIWGFAAISAGRRFHKLEEKNADDAAPPAPAHT